MSDAEKRCTLCGCPRVRMEDGTWGACTLLPGRDGKGGCPDPLHDYREEERAAKEAALRREIETLTDALRKVQDQVVRLVEERDAARFNHTKAMTERDQAVLERDAIAAVLDDELARRGPAPAFLQRTGLLAEINRLVLHPRGLALAVVREDSGEVSSFGGKLSRTDDPEGFAFGDDLSDVTERLQDAERHGELHPITDARRALFPPDGIESRAGAPEGAQDVLRRLATAVVMLSDDAEADNAQVPYWMAVHLANVAGAARACLEWLGARTTPAQEDHHG